MAPTPISPAQARVLQQAQAALAQGRLDAANNSLRALLREAPHCVPALGMAGVLAKMRGDAQQAATWFRQGLTLEAGDPRLYAGLGMSLFETGDADGAIAALQRACELAPTLPAHWYNLAVVLKAQVRTAEAHAALQRTLELDGAHGSARLTLAEVEASLGNAEAAARHLRTLLQAHPEHAQAWFALANLKIVAFSAADAAVLRPQFARAGAATEDRILLGFTLARALEDQGDLPASFQVLQQANALQRGALPWNATAHAAHVDQIERAFSAPLPGAADPQTGTPVIFIASMPRSGSSLVEQMLASHSAVEGANEISDLRAVLDEESDRRGQAFPAWVAAATAHDWQRMGDAYLARTARWRQHKPRFTDKHTTNWERIGAALQMLPAARVIVLRRSALETGLACFRQWFADGVEFSYALDDIAEYCGQFHRLTRFWLQRYPGQVLDLEYEAIQKDPETSVRALLDFCGLPFEPGCLEFHRTARTVMSAPSAAQVRQPLRRDTQRAAGYGALLDGLRQRLHALGLA